MDRPFRIHLKVEPPESGEKRLQRMRALRAIARGFAFTESVGDWVVESGDEEVLWLLVESRSLRFATYAPGSLKDRIARRAVRDAKSEGVGWTPLLDALSTRRILRPGTRTAERDRRTNGGPPTAAEMTARLVPWIAAQTDPAEVAALLVFESEEVRTVVARHARVLNDAMFDELIQTSAGRGALARNRTLPEAYRERLGQTVWERYRSERRRRNLTMGQMESRRILATMAHHPNGLPAPLREPVTVFLQRVSSPDRTLLDGVLADPLLQPDEARRIVKWLDPDEIVYLLADGRLDHKTMLEVSQNPNVASRIMALDGAPKAWLDRIAKVHKVNLQARLPAHPNVGAGTLRYLARQDEAELLWVMAEVAAARGEPEVRRALVGSRYPEVLRRMLHHARPDEYPVLLRKLLKRQLAATAAEIPHAPPPPGTVVPQDLVARLLEAPDSEHRLKAITMLRRLTPAT